MRSKSEELMLRIREYIEGYFERHSSVPTVREIAGAMKIAVSSAHRYLVAMAEKDMVFYENGTLSTPKIRRMNPAVSPAAIVGTIPCGSPEEKEARVEEYLPLSVSFFGKGDFYALRASGSSMEDAQIDDGDLVIIRQQHTAQVGEIVVALTDEDKNTLKRLLYIGHAGPMLHKLPDGLLAMPELGIILVLLHIRQHLLHGLLQELGGHFTGLHTKCKGFLRDFFLQGVHLRSPLPYRSWLTRDV